MADKVLSGAAIIDLRLYPFLADAAELAARKYGLSLRQLIELKPSILENAFKRLESAIRKSRVPKPEPSVEEEVLSHYFASLAASIIGDKWLISRLALAEAERAYSFMLNEPNEVIAAIARHVGLRSLVYKKALYREPVAIVRGVVVYSVFDFSMSFVEYVNVAKRLLGDPAWKPINMPVLRGLIYLRKDQVLRVIKEALAVFLEKRIGSLYSEASLELGESFNKLVENVKKVLAESRRPRITSKGRPFIPRGVIVEEAFPPCILDLVERAKRGENLSHHERFALATFMLNIGADIDSVVDLFRNMPDFNEKITRYQVEHLAGLRGSGKKYLVYSCEKMKTLGICKADCGTRSPLQAYYRNLKRIIRQGTVSEDNAKEGNDSRRNSS